MSLRDDLITADTDAERAAVLDANDVALRTLIASSGSGSGFTVFGETPTGTMDGSNAVFTLSAPPPGGKIGIGFFNVQVLVQDVDYVLSGATFQTLTYTTIRPNSANEDQHHYWY